MPKRKGFYNIYKTHRRQSHESGNTIIAFSVLCLIRSRLTHSTLRLCNQVVALQDRVLGRDDIAAVLLSVLPGRVSFIKAGNIHLLSNCMI